MRTIGETASGYRAVKVVGIVLALAVLVALQAPRAGAVSDAEELTRFGDLGAGAGELNLPAGVATDPVTGHVFMAEEGGRRISEFTPWGKFVKAFGWDVAPGAVNEQQEVRVSAGGGVFGLTFKGAETAPLPFDASAPKVETALNALSTIGGAGGSVSVEAVPGNPSGTTPYIYVVAFKGSLAGQDVPALEEGATALSGGDPSSSLVLRTRADGAAPGTGLESCTQEAGCKAGLQGDGAGQFSRPTGVAIDADGNIYVREVGNLRVQEFDPTGRFVLMFGGKSTRRRGTMSVPPPQVMSAVPALPAPARGSSAALTALASPFARWGQHYVQAALYSSLTMKGFSDSAWTAPFSLRLQYPAGLCRPWLLIR